MQTIISPTSQPVLRRALEIARHAVDIDSTHDDPQGAVLTYGESLVLLDEVLIRAMNDGHGNSEPSSRLSQDQREEEMGRLKLIYNTYRDRMEILSIIYGFPLPSEFAVAA